MIDTKTEDFVRTMQGHAVPIRVNPTALPGF